MKQKLKLLHTSDIHLDDRIGSGGEIGPGQAGLSAVVDAALDHEVDMMLIAGDLFDHNRVKDPCLAFATEQLARVTCPVVMITGNHDCMTDYSVYQRYSPEDAGGHIDFIREDDGASRRYEDLGLTIWARGIVDHHPGHVPLESVPDNDSTGWYLGMTHGFYRDREMQAFSSLISPEEIERSRFDYLALGHVHVFTRMQHGATLAAYAGSPNMAQGVKEMSAALVDLDPNDGASVEQLLLSPGAT